MDKNLFANKIAHYARTDPKHFLQMDAHYMTGPGRDDVMVPDEEGDWLSMSRTVELMQGSTTRVLVPVAGGMNP
jgi:hypothetical protein